MQQSDYYCIFLSEELIFLYQSVYCFLLKRESPFLYIIKVGGIPGEPELFFAVVDNESSTDS